MTISSRTEDLQILLAVVDSGSFSSAARDLDLQVAKVSRAVARLEQQLRCTLLNRTTRRLELTDEGQQFVEAIRNGLHQLADAEEQLRVRHQAPAGKLRLDAATPFMLHQLVPIMGAFRRRYPEIELELMTSENMIDLLERRTDVAIRIGELEDSNLHARLLGRSPLHLVASPDYLTRAGHPDDETELQHHSLLGFTQAPNLNRWPLREELMIRPALSASSGETLRQLCLAGEGIGLFSAFMIREDLAAGRLIEVLPGSVQSPHPREQVQAVYYRSHTLSPRISALLDYLQQQLML